MGRAWADYIDLPAADPDGIREARLHCGAQVGWSPLREGGTVPLEWACDLETGQTLVVEVCPECFSGFGDFRLKYRVVCLGCLRYSEDDKVVELLASHPVPDLDPEPGTHWTMLEDQEWSENPDESEATQCPGELLDASTSPDVSH